LLGLILAVVIVLAFALYRSRTSTNRLDVDPQAGREIEKAKRR
jgi:hypothetical protein